MVSFDKRGKNFGGANALIKNLKTLRLRALPIESLRRAVK